MKLDDYWQENRRFVQVVAGGTAAFLALLWFVGGRFQGRIDDSVRERSTLQGKLRKEAFTRADLDAAAQEGEALDAALAQLRAAVEFAPRPRFVVDPAGDTPSSQYLSAVQEVKDELLPLCNRASTVIDASLGLPELSPTREDDVARYLAALDLVDRVARLAVDVGVARIGTIRIVLDPPQRGRSDSTRVERTRVALTLLGPSGPELELLERLQRDPGIGPMITEDLLMKSTSQQVDEAQLELTLIVARLFEPAEDSTPTTRRN